MRGGLVGLLLAGLACGGSAPGVEPPDRILLFSMDTVRADLLSPFGGPIVMPELERVAAQGVAFRRFYAASSYTIPSHASIFTGLDPVEHGLNQSQGRIAPEIPTLAELLSEAGYRTQAFHEGGYVAGRFGFDRGFLEYRLEKRRSVVGDALPRVLDFLRITRGERSFLFIHTYAAHYPYGGFERYRAEAPQRGLPSDARLRELRERYPRKGATSAPARLQVMCTLHDHLAESRYAMLGCGPKYFPPRFAVGPHFERDQAALRTSYGERIAGIDAALGQIRRVLEELDEWDRTLLLVTSDHGEAFMEHGLQRHGLVPFNEVMRVPLVVSYPRALGGAGRRVQGLAWHLDLLPTILGIAGVRAPDGLRGLDLTPVLLGAARIPESRAIHPLALSGPQRPSRPARRILLLGSLKYIEGFRDFGDAEGLLFDLSRDPEERSNLRRDRAQDFNRLASASQAYAGELVPVPPVHQGTGEPLSSASESPELLTPEQRERLQELGYLD